MIRTNYSNNDPYSGSRVAPVVVWPVAPVQRPGTTRVRLRRLTNVCYRVRQEEYITVANGYESHHLVPFRINSANRISYPVHWITSKRYFCSWTQLSAQHCQVCTEAENVAPLHRTRRHLGPLHGTWSRSLDGICETTPESQQEKDRS